MARRKSVESFVHKIKITNLRNILRKLQITPLKFGGDWILHPKISNFRFYPLKL